jgi:hypothetical protein
MDVAKAKAETYEGTTLRLGHAWEDFRVGLGKYVTESPGVHNALQQIIDKLYGYADATDKARGKTHDFVGELAEKFVKTLMDSAEWIGKNTGLLKDMGIAIGILIGVNGLVSLIIKIGALTTAFETLGITAAAAWIKVAGPIGIAAAVGYGAYWAGQKIEGAIGKGNILVPPTDAQTRQFWQDKGGGPAPAFGAAARAGIAPIDIGMPEIANMQSEMQKVQNLVAQNSAAAAAWDASGTGLPPATGGDNSPGGGGGKGSSAAALAPGIDWVKRFYDAIVNTEAYMNNLRAKLLGLPTTPEEWAQAEMKRIQSFDQWRPYSYDAEQINKVNKAWGNHTPLQLLAEEHPELVDEVKRREFMKAAGLPDLSKSKKGMGTWSKGLQTLGSHDNLMMMGGELGQDLARGESGGQIAGQMLPQIGAAFGPWGALAGGLLGAILGHKDKPKGNDPNNPIFVKNVNDDKLQMILTQISSMLSLAFGARASNQMNLQIQGQAGGKS